MSHPKYTGEKYDIRPAKSLEEIDPLWSKSMLVLGWDRFGDDLATYMEHSQGRGMLLAFERGSSQPIGHVSAVINDNTTGWVALFIVEEAYRGVGVGAALFKNMLTDLSTLEYAGLDAVPAQKATYERRGFVESKLGVLGMNSRPFSAPAPQRSSEGLLDIHSISPKLLAEYELKYTGFLRQGLWENLLSRSDVIGFVRGKADATTVEDVSAIGVLRRCPGGSRLGPLYADDVEGAEAILKEIIVASTSQYVRKFPFKKPVELDGLSEQEITEKAVINAEIWTGNAAAVTMFEKLGFTQSGVLHRMWLNDKATSQQSAGGTAQIGVFAAFDAAIG